MNPEQPVTPEPTVFTPAYMDSENWGQGGNFIVGTDGKRTRVPDPASGEITGDGSGEALPPFDATVERTAPATKKGK